MNDKVLEAVDISFYDQLHRSSFYLREGFTTLMGPSGSGKSTCAQLLIGALKLSSGEVNYLSKSGESQLTIRPETGTGVFSHLRLESNQQRKVKRYIIQYCGYVAQSPELPKDMTVRDYIYNVRRAAGNILDGSYVEWLLGRLGIINNIDRNAATQSGGEQQRTAIAFALANKPSLLIADEPNASLDTASGMDVLELMRELATDGMSVLWITHTPDHEQYADNRLYVRDGIVREAIQEII